MAFAQASDPSAMTTDGDRDAESCEEMLPRAEEGWISRRRATVGGLIVGALVACAVAAVGFLPSSSAATAASSAKSQTVRDLLEGPELANVVTDNFMGLGRGYLHPAQRKEVRDAVAVNLKNISSSIRMRLPDDHARFGGLRVTQAQKESVMRFMGRYSDPRVRRLGDDIAHAVAETRGEAGDRQALQRRLLAKLQPRLPELRELCDDIAPGSGRDFSLDIRDFDSIEPAQPSGKSNLKVEMTPLKVAHGGPAVGSLAARRLAPADTLSGTREQTSIALRHLHGMLGESMPTAPARMLLFEKQKEYESQTTGWERFEACVVENSSSPPEMFQCLMKNCRRAMTWLMEKLHLGDVMQKMASQ